MKNVQIQVKRMEHAQGLPLPHYQTSGAVGMDLYAATSSDVELKPGDRQLVPTGLQVAIPQGYEMQIRPRSGWAYKQGVTVVNAPGTIDPDYRGEVKVLLLNAGQQTVHIQRGDRIAQAVIAPVIRAQLEEVGSLDETSRGEGGFGHTGKTG